MLDPGNEEAKLGLRWASLRRQTTGTPARSPGSVSTADFISPNFDTGSFAANSAANGGMNQGGPQSSVPFGPAQPSPAAAAEAAAETATETPAPVPAPVPKRGGLSVAAIIMILAIIVLVGVFIWLMYMQ
jgi:cobalamin biosynthesis Mg chelatase CobN